MSQEVCVWTGTNKITSSLVRVQTLSQFTPVFATCSANFGSPANLWYLRCT